MILARWFLIVAPKETFATMHMWGVGMALSTLVDQWGPLYLVDLCAHCT
jgi:hypothetical protein